MPEREGKTKAGPPVLGSGYTYDVQPDMWEGVPFNYWQETLVSTVPGTLDIEPATLASVMGDRRNIFTPKIASFSYLQWVTWTETVQALAPFTTGEVELPYSIFNRAGTNCLKWSFLAMLAAISEAKVEL